MKGPMNNYFNYDPVDPSSSEESDGAENFGDEWELIVRRDYDRATKIKILRSYANLLANQLKAELPHDPEPCKKRGSPLRGSQVASGEPVFKKPRTPPTSPSPHPQDYKPGNEPHPDDMMMVDGPYDTVVGLNE